MINLKPLWTQLYLKTFFWRQYQILFWHFKVFWYGHKMSNFENVSTKPYGSFGSNTPFIPILSVLAKLLTRWTPLPIKCLQPPILLNYPSELAFTVHHGSWVAPLANVTGIWDFINMVFHCFVDFLVLSKSRNFPHKIVKDDVQKRRFSIKLSMKISSWL